MAILKVRDENGKVIDIPAIKGKSAYEYAKEGGYTGTEADFIKDLAESELTDKMIKDALGYTPVDSSGVNSTAESKVTSHNTSNSSHSDIRLLIDGLTSRLNALANSDDTTLDQMAEVVAYIKNNKNLIDGITTSKVNVSDIINNLTTSVSNKPLSAKQGVELKKLIDSIVIPTLLSQLGEDSTHRTVTDSEKSTWNSKINKTELTKAIDTAIENLDECKIFYATCDTEAATAEKAVTVFNNPTWELEIGKVIMISFSITNTASNVTLNVNGTGAYPIWYNNAEYTSNGSAYTGYAQRVTTYMFNGTHWVWITNSYDSNTTYTNVKLGHGYATCSTAEATTAKVGTLSSYTLTTGGIVAVKFTNAVPANATLNINSKGAKAIYYRGAKITADVIKAGDTATFIYSTYYHLISIDRWQDDISELRGEIDDHKTQLDGKQPRGNYALKEEIPSIPVKSVNGKTGAVVLSASDVGATTKEYVDGEITDVKALLNQITFNKAEGTTVSEAVEWLKINGDTKQAYILPDGLIYAYMKTVVEVGGGSNYTNALDGTTKHINQRWSHSGKKLSSANGYMTTDKLEVSADQTVYVNLPRSAFLGNYPRVHYFDSSGNYVSKHDGTPAQSYILTTDDNGVTSWVVGYENSTFNDASTNGRMANADTITHMVMVFNMSIVVSGTIDVAITDNDVADIIVSVGNPIEESEPTTIITYDWASTGYSFIETSHDDDIASLKRITTANTSDIEELKQIVESGVGGAETDSQTLIKNWDAPIYDAHIPVFQLSTEKDAMTNAVGTPDAIYAKYDALMSKHPKYITKTDLGLCSDGKNHVYRYDFKEPEPLHESNKEWSETKTKAIIVTGIHFEWAGIYAMYNALEEIAENPELRNFRRNTHLIVVPVANPYATIANNYQSGLSTPNSYGVRNANGVEIHRNFEVDWVASTEGSTHYGGASPLSEVETQYIDNIMKNNVDASVFLSCHNCGVDTFWGTGFIWASTATKYMCNVGYRVIDKMSDAWIDKYGDILQTGIEEYKTDLLEDGDTRLGWAGLSSTAGTEAKQATKYGIQGTNVEICNPFQIHGTKANPEPSMSAFTLSRGAETYINFLLTACGVYDYKDKEQYYK